MDGADKYVVCINIASVIGIWYLGWCYWYLVLGMVLLVIGIWDGVIGIWYWGLCISRDVERPVARPRILSLDKNHISKSLT